MYPLHRLSSLRPPTASALSHPTCPTAQRDSIWSRLRCWQLFQLICSARPPSRSPTQHARPSPQRFSSNLPPDTTITGPSRWRLHRGLTIALPDLRPTLISFRNLGTLEHQHRRGLHTSHTNGSENLRPTCTMSFSEGLNAFGLLPAHPWRFPPRTRSDPTESSHASYHSVQEIGIFFP